MSCVCVCSCVYLLVCLFGVVVFCVYDCAHVCDGVFACLLFVCLMLIL